ncbi:MAG: YhcH/YjgK/YiaL family protein [Turicibacter sp.]
MIIGNLKDILKYKGLNKNLDTAIEYLSQHDLFNLTLGRTTIEGDDVFINRFDYTTQPLADCFFEGHECYTDIHIVLEGNETIGVTDISYLTVEIPYDEVSDFTKYSGPIHTYNYLTLGQFIITFPEDIHMPKIQPESPSATTKKLVVKVKM